MRERELVRIAPIATVEPPAADTFAVRRANDECQAVPTDGTLEAYPYEGLPEKAGSLRYLATHCTRTRPRSAQAQLCEPGDHEERREERGDGRGAGGHTRRSTSS